MLIYIVRHAWAGEPDETQYPDDSQRPLTEKGRRRFRRLVKRLVKRGFAPEHVATSPLLRCRQTAEVIVDLAPTDANLTVLEALAPEARLDELLSWTRGLGVHRVAWVGHAPDVGELTAALIGAPRGRIDFAKGAVAAVECDADGGSGSLAWFATAEILGR